MSIPLLLCTVSPAAAQQQWHYHLKFGDDFMGYDNMMSQWDSANDRILYFSRGADGYYDIYITNQDKTANFCVTCDRVFLPNRHMGSPFFLPGGEFIAFAAERATHPNGYCQYWWCGSFAALPGYGAYNDLWIVRSDGTKAWQLTAFSDTQSTALIIPVVSPDGRKIMWSNHSDNLNPFASDWHFWGRWQIQIADLVWSSGAYGVGDPGIVNIRTFEPQLGLNEGSSFTPDSRRIQFTSTNPSAPLQTTLWSVDVDTLTDLRQLTSDGGFNEHPIVTPSGEQIVFMSLNESSNDSEIWIMNADGTGQQRLTYINEPWHPEWTGWSRLTGGTALASTDTTYPVRIKNLQLPNMYDYRGLIKQGVITRRVADNGTGLRAQYFADPNFGSLAMTRIDPHLSFYWKDGQGGRQASSPAPGVVPPDNFSARWTGQVQAYGDSGGSYSFRCVYADHCKVWINGRLIIDPWFFWPGTADGSVTLAPGAKYSIKVELVAGGWGDAQLRLAWKNADFDWEIVPDSQLYPDPSGHSD
jgi:hypothetical protein